MMKRWSVRSLLVLISVVLGLAIGELALRAMDFSYYWSLYKRPDPQRGWAPRPGAVGWQRLEGQALVRINSAGFRDREHALQKPPATVRVAVLGDSFTAAVQVPMEETFWFVIEQQLQGCDALADRAVEVINFGVSGYSTAQELLTLRHRAWDYQPDIVLLAFFAGNDFTENLQALDDDPLRPYFVYQGEALVLDDAFLQSDDYRSKDAWYGRLALGLLDRSRLFQAMDRATDLARVWFQQRQSARPEDAPAQEPGVDNRIYKEPQDPDWAASWRVTEGLLKAMNREVIDQGARFLTVTLSTGAQVHPNPLFREKFKQTLGVDHLFYPDQRLRALGEREGFPVLNLAPSLQFQATWRGMWLHGFENKFLGAGHWNRLGHQLAGGMMADFLCREGFF